MALLGGRLSLRLKNAFAISSRCYSKKDLEVIQPMELATGKEKFELLAMQAGNEDPFSLNAIKRRPNSKADPIPVPSFFDSRLVGCICEEDSNHVNWFWLHMGEPKRCYCGHWFKLESYDPL